MACGGGPEPGCGCWTGAWWGVGNPPMCPAHSPWSQQYTTGTGTTTTLMYPPASPERAISDSDVERIAQRVAELLKPPATSGVSIVYGDAFADDSPRNRQRVAQKLVAKALGRDKPKRKRRK